MSRILSVPNKPFKLRVVMLSVIMLNVIRLNVIMLNAILPHVIMPNVVAPYSLVCFHLLSRVGTYFAHRSFDIVSIPFKFF